MSRIPPFLLPSCHVALSPCLPIYLAPTQAAWAFLCLLPITYLNSLSVMGGAFTFPRFHGDYGVRDAIAVLSRVPAVTALVGVAVEAVADWQKSAFRADQANKDRWCDVGLYKYVRSVGCFTPRSALFSPLSNPRVASAL